VSSPAPAPAPVFLSSPNSKTRRRRIRESLETRWSEPVEDSRLAGVIRRFCSSTHECVAVGRFQPLINRLFRQFETFEFASPSGVRRLGEISANGLVAMIPYERYGVQTWRVLKTMADGHADSLWVEGWLGTYIVNPLISHFPCFLETHGMFRFASDQSSEQWRMKDFVTPLQTNQLRCWRNAWLHYNEACANPVQSALLIQHVHPSRTLYNWAREFILRNPATREAQEEWAGWMVQLHFALWALEGVFQHRDLHENNILVYSPLNPNEYLTFRYHLGGLQGKTSRVMEMKSRSWVVMVDYGRVWGKGRVPTPSPDGRGWTETPADSASWLFRQLSSVQNCSEYARRTPEMFQSYSAYPRDVDLMVANGFQSIVQEWTPNWFHGQSWTSAKDVCLEYYDFLTTNFHLHAGRSQFQKETWTECGTVDVYGDGRPMKWNLYPRA
jgi:hypothetical protein